MEGDFVSYPCILIIVGPHTISLPEAYRISSAGKNVPGTKTKIMDPDEEGNGEVRQHLIL